MALRKYRSFWCQRIMNYKETINIKKIFRNRRRPKSPRRSTDLRSPVHLHLRSRQTTNRNEEEDGRRGGGRTTDGGQFAGNWEHPTDYSCPGKISRFRISFAQRWNISRLNAWRLNWPPRRRTPSSVEPSHTMVENCSIKRLLSEKKKTFFKNI